jgi:tripartite-type tricarboxylate transporter receptor subunit TctC
VRVLNLPDVKEKFLNAGVEVVASSPEQFAATIKSEIAKIGKVIKDAGIKTN